MIHILTVHWKDDRWVDIQLEYFKKHIREPYKVYAFLNSLPRDHRGKYFHSSTEDIQSHAIKLNLLADMAILHADNDDDWLMFIDGDAFPIGDIVSFAHRKLREYPLLAIQRKENVGDIRPHPSFCITTVKFWKEIKGDWKSDHKWRDATGNEFTDPGGNLFSILENRKIRWFPLLRSNKTELHQIFFGIFEDLIYHHGAGFRQPYARVDLQRYTTEKIPFIGILLKKRREKIMWRRIVKENKILSERVYQSILSDTNFYKFFLESDHR